MEGNSVWVNEPPELKRYIVSSTAERDWLLRGALGYLQELELTRPPSQRLATRALPFQGLFLLRPLTDRALRRFWSRCMDYLTESECAVIQLNSVKSKGLDSEDSLLCLAAQQHAYSTYLLGKRLAKQGGADDQLWQICIDFLYFCHSHAYAPHVEYEERTRYARINRNTPRLPEESYAEWRNRASPGTVELRPLSIQFLRSDESPIAWREDRTVFHKRWLDAKLSEAWERGYRPFSW